MQLESILKYYEHKVSLCLFKKKNKSDVLFIESVRFYPDSSYNLVKPPGPWKNSLNNQLFPEYMVSLKTI